MIWGVFGAGGCGRGLLPLLRSPAQTAGAQLVFIDDHKTGPVNGEHVMIWSSFSSVEGTKAVCLAVSDPSTRQKLAQQIMQEGCELLEARHSSVIVMDDVLLGEGACLSPGTILTSNIQVGMALHANLGCFIEHDCKIGNFVTLAPGVRLNGSITVGDRAYIGSGATIRQGLTIGADAVIGMGAVVLEDVAPGRTVVGNPAREIR